MYIIVILSLLAFTSATPIMVHDYGGNFFMPFIGTLRQIDRSDEHQFSNDFSGDHTAALQSDNYNSNHQDLSIYGDYGGGHQDLGGHQDIGGNQDFGGHQDLGGHGIHNYEQTVPVSEHVEVTKPVAVPVYKDIGIPVPHPVKINIPHPVAIGVPQPYPVAVPVSKPVPIQVVKTIAVPVEKKVPYPVEKHIPVPIEKPVPITIEKHVPVPVFKPYPIKIPVYKTVYHHSKHH